MNLARKLDRIHARYAAKCAKGDYGLDPIAIPHSFSMPGDIEVVAFLASCFAYGSRKVFVPLVTHHAKRLGEHPARTLREAESRDLRKFARDFRYRFNDAQDLEALYAFLSQKLRKYDTLGAYFEQFYRPKHEQPILRMLECAARGFQRTAKAATSHQGVPLRASTLYLFPNPAKGSTCKRALMFSRWMIRRAQPDFGLWTWAKPRHLIVPLDTHLKRVAINLGLVPENASSSLRTAVVLTDALRRYDPKDPTRFDYALYSLGADERAPH